MSPTSAVDGSSQSRQSPQATAITTFIFILAYPALGCTLPSFFFSSLYSMYVSFIAFLLFLSFSLSSLFRFPFAHCNNLPDSSVITMIKITLRSGSGLVPSKSPSMHYSGSHFLSLSHSPSIAPGPRVDAERGAVDARAPNPHPVDRGEPVPSEGQTCVSITAIIKCNHRRNCTSRAPGHTQHCRGLVLPRVFSTLHPPTQGSLFRYGHHPRLQM